MSRPKSILNPRIKGMVEWQLEHYHDDKRALEAYKRDLIPSATPNYSGMPSAHTASRSTENNAENILTNSYVLHTELSCKAIERVIDNCSELDKTLIDIVYWRRAITIVGAAEKLNMNPSTAYRHINAILLNIASEMGYVTK